MSNLIYKATNIINNKAYIGKAVSSVEVRKQQHYRDALNGCDFIFHRAIRKYGFENFKWEILYNNVPKEQLGFAEICAIYTHDSLYNGYNMTFGGEGCLGRITKEETKQKISIANRGENSPMFGKHLSEEMKKKLSESHMGKTFSLESRQKMSMSRIGEKNPMFGKSRSAEARKTTSEKNKNKIPWNVGLTKESDRRLAKMYAGRKKGPENKKWRQDITLEILEKAATENGFECKKVAKFLDYHRDSIRNRLKYFGFKNWTEFCTQVKQKYNV